MTQPIDDRQKTDDRGPGGRFVPGNPGGPGRPPGRGPVAEMRAALATDLDKIIETVKAQALAGDAQAIRIILDRVLPALRPVDLPTALALPADSPVYLYCRSGNRSGQAAGLLRQMGHTGAVNIGGISALVSAGAKPA